MTLEDLRDWHARRAGWNKPGTNPEPTGDAMLDAIRQTLIGGTWWKIVGNDFKRSLDHPFPATLDGADASFPKGQEWNRYWDYFSGRVWKCGEITVHDTGDKIHDLYELSKLAWEQEAA